jgi:hypothetical protein
VRREDCAHEKGEYEEWRNEDPEHGEPGPCREGRRRRVPADGEEDMPLDACASGPLVFATRMATTADAMTKATMYPPATTATLRDGFMALVREGRLTFELSRARRPRAGADRLERRVRLQVRFL